MSTAIALRFLAGRYHANPWGSHVNEATVEWPPSPWRLLRALIAVWHLKVGPGEATEADLERLIIALAGTRPHFRLPEASSGHSRHYMPVRKGRSETTTLVFDAFASVPRNDDLIMLWPQLDLEEALRKLFDLLLRRMGYLGRAESWVEARLLDGWAGELNCVPQGSRQAERDVQEVVRVAVPMDPATYEAWRDHEVVAHGLDESQLRVREKRLLATLPEDLLGALRLSTGRARAQGWSQHPGMTTVDYLRPSDALDHPAREPRREVDDRQVTTARLILTGNPLPRIEDAVKIGEAVRAGVMKKADEVTEADGKIPSVLSGHGMGSDNQHEHAFYLPEDFDPATNGHIDRVIVHAARGFDATSLKALASLHRIWLDQGSEWAVIFEWSGSGDDLEQHPLVGTADVWTSVTPYLHPWFRKKNFTIEDQILRECRLRELPEPDLERLSTVRVKGRDRRPVHFHRFRKRGKRRASQPDTTGSFWRLSFPELVRGPIALGFACHFGLGMFRRGE